MGDTYIIYDHTPHVYTQKTNAQIYHRYTRVKVHLAFSFINHSFQIVTIIGMYSQDMLLYV